MDTPLSRRDRMQVRVFRSLHEHDRADAAYWASLAPEVRVEQVWLLSEAQWRMVGEFPDASGLPRSVACLHRP